MATVSSAGAASASSSSNANSNTKETDWSTVSFMPQQAENTVSDETRKSIWEQIYRAARATNEEDRKQVRLAVYAYMWLNGTSRAGEYNAMVNVGNGTRFEASEIVKATGRFSIRRFARSNMSESYRALKASGVVYSSPTKVVHLETIGIPRENAFAAADWLNDCPDFSVAESDANKVAFKYALQRSSRSRGGDALEDVEHRERAGLLRAQGSVEDHPNRPVLDESTW